MIVLVVVVAEAVDVGPALDRPLDPVGEAEPLEVFTESQINPSAEPLDRGVITREEILAVLSGEVLRIPVHSQYEFDKGSRGLLMLGNEPLNEDGGPDRDEALPNSVIRNGGASFLTHFDHLAPLHGFTFN